MTSFIQTVLRGTHPSWRDLLTSALATLDDQYIKALTQHSDWLPGATRLLAAFSLPLTQTRTILYGESPYPRHQSANGYAFWDGAVTDIWSPQGLSKAVNRATSLRNFIKMLLVSDHVLCPTNTGTQAVAALDTRRYCQSLDQLFNRMIHQGFLLLNVSPVLSARSKLDEARQWLGFHDVLLSALARQTTPPQLLLFGKIADRLQGLNILKSFEVLYAEHPYNLSFITNPQVLAFFKGSKLLDAT